jgi:hypothetical protein
MSEQPGWDDERLAAAFQGLDAWRAPAALADSIHDRISGTRPGRRWLGSWSRPLAAGAIGLAAIVVAGALVGLGQLGDPSHVAGASPSPSASGPVDSPSPSITPPSTPPDSGPGWWPPSGAITFDLTSQVAAGAPPVRLAVVDQSERMTDVEETGDVDPSTVQLDGRYGAYAEPGHPGRIHLVWVGGICDTQITITITAGIRSILFDMGPQPSDCDTLGVQRQVVLDFDRPVDVAAIELLDAGASPTTQPEGGYVLDCGPLGPDTCATKAAEILDEQRLDVPSVQFESIVFTDSCGSYVARFDNGSGRSSVGDCPLD